MIKIENATIQDVKLIVGIHLDAFKGFFLTSLGSDFLTFYYKCFINSKDSEVKVFKSDGVILGFSAATIRCKGFNTSLIKQNITRFVMLALKLFFTNPSALVRLIKNITKKSNTILDDEEYAELYSIGVESSVQGQGIGRCLLQETERTLKDRGVERVSLTTDYYNNDKTLNFYKSMGYMVKYDFIAYPHRRMFRLIKELDEKII